MANQYTRSSTLFSLALKLNMAFQVVLLLGLVAPPPASAHEHSKSKCVLFNFGDSNSDSGAYAAGLGFYLGPPFGQQFFHKTTGRFSNGRLYVDFICESLKIEYLSPYLESTGSDFSHGMNFAVAGASTQGSPNNPFTLTTQALQFAHFLNRTRELGSRGKETMISEREFENAVYSIDIGQNDLTIAFLANSSYESVVDTIPIALQRIENATKALYKVGGRKFWIYNTGPLGCIPQTLALRKTNDSELDKIGCMAVYNNAAKTFNEGLSDLCDKLKSQLEDATIVLTDMYAIKYDLFSNPRKYGFENPLMACCGHGGPPHNYAQGKSCAQPTASACLDPSKSVSWDGVHYTEAANAIIASKILSSNYSNPYLKLKKLCK